jgi:signal transduction histidine kinase
LALSDATIDPRYAPLPSTLEIGCRAYLCAPLRIQEEIVGVMTARKKEIYQFSHEEVILFETICKQVAIVIEKSRMYEQKIQAERLAAVAVSLSGVAHYIKNVLLTMQGGEYLVQQGLDQGHLERAREGWDVLKRANKKIRKLVENILNYCRQTEPYLRAVNLNAMIGDMIRSLEETARERDVVIQAELDRSIEEIWVDPEIFYDALLNLVINGIEAIPEGKAGRVRVRTHRLSGRNQVLIEVADSGEGIPEALYDKIFNLFFTTKGKKGTGIGLASARKTIEAHGGTIELAHPLDGEGAHFKIYLPITPQESMGLPLAPRDF